MSAKHTPGPWTAAAGRILGGFGAVAKMVDQSTNYRAQQEADARLIAAAPELLAALEWLVRDADCDYTSPEDSDRRVVMVSTVEAARAAVAKARGK